MEVTMKTRKPIKSTFILLKNLSSITATGITLVMFLLLSTTTNAQECKKIQDCKKTESTGKQPLTSVLKKCADKGDLEKIKAITAKDEKVVNERLEKDETMLTIAAYNGHYDVVAFLIDKGANIHLRNQSNNNALINASIKGHADVVKLLIDQGAKINARGNGGKTALHYAAQNNRTDVVKLLVDNNCYINPQDDENRIPLTYASWSGNPEIIKTLADEGANVNYTSSGNYTILHNLAWGKDVEPMNIILEAGADANVLNEDGILPLHTAVSNGNHKAVKLLLGYTKNINQPEKHCGNTPLHLAVKNGDLISYQILTEAGADQNLFNNASQKPIDMASQYGQTEIISYCISKNLATKQNLKLAEENRKACLQKAKEGEAQVYYLGHSGWAVRTENSVLIFDYWSRSKLSGSPGLVNGTINPDEIKDKNVYVFVSHDHGDHYDEAIYPWSKSIKNITYVYGFDPNKSKVNKEKGYNGPDFVYIENNQSKNLGNAKISTLQSNDTGQGFLVEIDGVSIYHPGDHALFTKEDEPGFKKEVNYIAGINSNVDIAFLPVTGCPVRWKKENIVEGFFYTVDKLNPKEVYPMHAFNREYTLQEFADIAKERDYSTNIVCVNNCGDQSLYNKNMLATK